MGKRELLLDEKRLSLRKLCFSSRCIRSGLFTDTTDTMLLRNMLRGVGWNDWKDRSLVGFSHLPAEKEGS